MGDVKDLSNSKAIEKIKELAEEIDICMFCTYSGDVLESRPMSTQKVDEEGNLWFLSDKSSNKNRDVLVDDRVELFYAQGKEKYLSLHGRGEVLFDKQKIKELWKTHAKIWFTEGENDPRISIIKVKFLDGHYWDSKHGKMVQLTKMAAALLTGKTMDDNIEGNLN